MKKDRRITAIDRKAILASRDSGIELDPKGRSGIVLMETRLSKRDRRPIEVPKSAIHLHD